MIYSIGGDKMKELDSLCKAILEKKIKSLQKCIDLHQEDLVTAKELYGWRKITNYINQNAGTNLKETFLTNMFYRSLKSNKTLALKAVKGTSRENTIVEKKSSTEPLQKGDNVERKNSSSFKSFKNLNRISLNLIDKYGIDLETLKSLGVMTIQDRTIMEGKIKTYCQSIDSQNLKNEYSHILKKDN